jgi:hypothetical protein
LPFTSKAQQRFLHAHPEKVGGATKLKEWDRATDFSHLPARAAKKKDDEEEKRTPFLKHELGGH